MRVERSRDHRMRDLSGPCAYTGGNTAEDQRIRIHGISERQEQHDDIPKIREHEICIPEPLILVQGILCRHGRQEHESDQGIHSEPVEDRQGE